MLADLDLLLIAVFCAADDLLPKARNNAKRMVTDAEVVTLCVAQAIMGITTDPRFLAVARKRLGHLFPVLPDRAGFYKRAPARARRSNAAGPAAWLTRSATLPTTASAPATAASFTGFGCTRCVRSTAPRARWR